MARNKLWYKTSKSSKPLQYETLGINDLGVIHRVSHLLKIFDKICLTLTVNFLNESHG